MLGGFGSKIDLSKIQDYRILQYTGKNDKNGVRIFEGDIVCGKMDFGPAGLHVVTLPIYFDDENGYQWHCWELTSLEVVGNVYRNPELI